MTIHVKREYGFWILTWSNPFSGEAIRESREDFASTAKRVSDLLHILHTEAPSTFENTP